MCRRVRGLATKYVEEILRVRMLFVSDGVGCAGGVFRVARDACTRS